MIAKLQVNHSLEEQHFTVITALTNQVRSRTLCSPQRATTTITSLLLLLYDSPCLHALITPKVRCTGHKKVPTPAARAKAWPDSLSPDPSHFTFIVCLTGFDRHVPIWAPPDLQCPPPTCRSVSRSTKTTESVSVLCVPTIHRMVFVSWLSCQTHTHTHTQLSATDASMCVYQLCCQELHHQAPYHCLFHKANHREEET